MKRRKQGIGVLAMLGFVMSLAGPVRAQQGGAEVQAYPAGLIVTGRGAWALSAHDLLIVQGGYNTTNRRDWGEHAHEEGGGFGAGLAGRHYFGAGYRSWLVGVRADLWFLTIDWEEEGRTGSSDIRVLQPTGLVGYAWHLADARLVLEPTIALGAEINVWTEGESVGEGAILLVGIALSYRL